MSGIRKLSPELQEKATKELNEDPKRIQDDLKYIKTWLSKQQYITARTDDQFLITFLRGCKFSLERTKEKLDMYYTLRTLSPEFFTDRDPMKPEIQEILKLGLFVPLPKVDDPAGPRYSIMKNALTGNSLNQADIFKVTSMIQDIMIMEDDNFVVAGTVGIHDMAEMNLQQILGISPTTIKKGMQCFQKAYPSRIKGVHFVNTSSIFEKVNQLFGAFLTDKIKSRMTVHSNINDLYKFVPKTILPEEYGGEGGKMNDMVLEWKNKIESYRDWFIEDEKYKTNEKKRPGKPKTSESVFGIDGSFRQLSVD